MLCIMQTINCFGILLHPYVCFLTTIFLYFLFSMKASMKNWLLKNNTEDVLLVKENTDKEDIS